jgi:hypothetical protein
MHTDDQSNTNSEASSRGDTIQAGLFLNYFCILVISEIRGESIRGAVEFRIERVLDFVNRPKRSQVMRA